MEKKLALLLVTAFLMVCSVSNAQIGVSRKGELLNYNWWGAVYINHFDDDSKNVFKIPVFLDGTKYVKIKILELKYDMFNDGWLRKDSCISIVDFDSLGRINRSKFEKSISKTEYCNENRYEYENGRINKIYYNDKLLFSFRYDKSGNLKTIMSGIYQWSVFYSPQGAISQIRRYEEGEELSSSPINYKYTSNGYSIIPKPMRIQCEYYYQTDKYGSLTKRTKIEKEKEEDYWGNYTGKVLKKTETDYYENTYDENGNLIKQLHYQMKDVGKYYIDGYELSYEYLYE